MGDVNVGYEKSELGEVTAIKLKADKTNVPALNIDFSPSDFTYDYNFYWRGIDISYDDIESLLEKDERINFSEENISSTKTNYLEFNGKDIGVRFRSDKYRIVTNTMSHQLIIDHYLETVDGAERQDIKAMIEHAEQEISE